MTAASEETFLQRRIRIKAERDALANNATIPTPRTSAPAFVLAGDIRAERWILAKLEAQLADLATMQPDTGRNHALNAIAYSLGRYVPKWLDEQTTTGQLYTAARACGLEHTEIGPTIRSGILAGQASPLDPPTSSGDHSSLTDLVAGPIITQPPATTSVPGIDPTTGEIVTS